MHCQSRFNSCNHASIDWCNKDRGMCYPVCGMMHIKESSERVDHVAAAGLLSRYLSGPLPYSV